MSLFLVLGAIVILRLGSVWLDSRVGPAALVDAAVLVEATALVEAVREAAALVEAAAAKARQ